MWIGDFTVDQQRQAGFLHLFQRRIAVADIGDTGIRISGSAGGIQLQPFDKTAFTSRDDFFRRGIVRQVQGHQWFEFGAIDGSQDAVEIFHRLYYRGHRWVQVRHDDSTGELLRGKRRNAV